MSRGWDAVTKIGLGLMEKESRKKELEEERKYAQEQAELEEARAIRKEKALAKLRADNEAAAEAAKAAREQVKILGEGQYLIHSNDPTTGKANVRVEGERKPNYRYLNTDEGVLEYDPATGSRKRIAGLPPRQPPAPAAWNDPSTISRDLDEEWSRVRTQLDTKISDIEAALLDPRQQRNAEGLRLQLKNTRKLRDERKAEIDSRKAAIMGGTSPQAQAPRSGGGLMDILGNAAATAFRYGRNEQDTAEGITSGAVPLGVGAQTLSAQSGQPVRVSLDGSSAKAGPKRNPEFDAALAAQKQENPTKSEAALKMFIQSVLGIPEYK